MQVVEANGARIPAIGLGTWELRGRTCARVIEQAIKHLPEPFRDVYLLADVEGLPNAEIGEMLGLSVPAVKSRLHRAPMRMRDMLAPHFEEEVTS